MFFFAFHERATRVLLHISTILEGVCGIFSSAFVLVGSVDVEDISVSTVVAVSLWCGLCHSWGDMRWYPMEVLSWFKQLFDGNGQD